ncbi:MAG: ParB/RepB/Spo0J family partition protein [Gemmatimonadaceae bacterium]|nr:ParB/RepB/Spo0J family partition protein [Gemmatimonadaceae bacterium]
MSTEKPRRLGRGLEALIAAKPSTAGPGQPAERGGGLERIPIGQIRPNPYQPRQEFKPEDLAELEASLRTSGLLQPITVRRAPTGQGYELIAGERRLRAATRIGWTDIPAVVKDIDDRTLLTLALVENLQRANLNPIEEAEGYQRLIAEFSLTQHEVAELVGKDRTTVANTLRLLNLPASVRRLVQDGQLTLGHARALLAVGNEMRIVELAREVVAKGLTVRDVERRARETNSNSKAPPKTQNAPSNPQTKRIADELRRHFQTDVTISLTGDNRGAISIAFYSTDDLERVLELILGHKREEL